jgi:hypothetical protein
LNLIRAESCKSSAIVRFLAPLTVRNPPWFSKKSSATKYWIRISRFFSFNHVQSWKVFNQMWLESIRISLFPHVPWLHSHSISIINAMFCWYPQKKKQRQRGCLKMVDRFQIETYWNPPFMEDVHMDFPMDLPMAMAWGRCVGWFGSHRHSCWCCIPWRSPQSAGCIPAVPGYGDLWWY